MTSHPYVAVLCCHFEEFGKFGIVLNLNHIVVQGKIRVRRELTDHKDLCRRKKKTMVSLELERVEGIEISRRLAFQQEGQAETISIKRRTVTVV